MTKQLLEKEAHFERGAKRRSMMVSIGLHAGIFMLFLFWTCSPPTAQEDLTEITWAGGGGTPNSEGPVAESSEGEPDASSSSEASESQKTAESQSEPKTDREPVQNTEETIPTKTKESEKSEKTSEASTSQNSSSNRQDDKNETNAKSGQPEVKGSTPAKGAGGVSVGFSVGDGFGSRGWTRSPQATAPGGTSHQGTVTLKFTVLPDGRVTGIRPVRRAHSSLVALATRALSRAKARKLPGSVPQESKSYTITYRFVLK